MAARTREVTVACLDCGCGSARVHSRYGRALAEFAGGGHPVVIGLSMRRLFCDGPTCGRRTFAGRVEGLSARYQNRNRLRRGLYQRVGVPDETNSIEPLSRTLPPGQEIVA
ncbi:hypothetical protein [Streptomyces sp. NPDC048419]|uniref:hypothetical protein n=1 Tax=Streptomyces sp. NPDC048419 TaxID=3365547 RepID=UPI0037130B89